MSKNTHVNYKFKPIVIDATIAHQEKYIIYNMQGIVTFHNPELGNKSLQIAPSQQFPGIFATFEDINKTLSQFANSPATTGQKTLRQKFDEEYNVYQQLIEKTYESNRWEPDYGTYIFDRITNNLFLIAPEK